MNSSPATDPTFADDVRTGLTDPQKWLSSKYFYDDAGTRLFQRIMALPEYYLTRTEDALLRTHSPAIAQHWAGGALDVIELGAGDGTKTLHLLRALQAVGTDVRYLPIDISQQALHDLEANVHRVLPGLPLVPILADWHAGLASQKQSQRPKLVVFLGSNIGNLVPAVAEALLRTFAEPLRRGDHLLIGFDRVKDPAILVPAYADSQGVTAAFNLNLLTRINRELGADFQLDAFQHHALYNPTRQAMESYLLSKTDQMVYIRALDLFVAFTPWEAIHQEYSYKYTPQRIDALAAAAGIVPQHRYEDAKAWFSEVLFAKP